MARAAPAPLPPAALSAESRLRAAVASENKTVFRLMEDIRLTADIGEVKCPDLEVVGECKKKNGRPRLCKIDGQNSYGGFGGMSPKVSLRNLELTRFRSAILAGGPSCDFKISNCHLTSNAGAVVSTAVVSSVTIANSSFVGNKGILVSTGRYDKIMMTDVLFKSNRGGPVISLQRATLTCVRCGFEGNLAESGASAVEVYRMGAKFTRSWFVNNRVTKPGSQGAAVSLSGDSATTFCHCRFDKNTVAEEGGKRKRIEHVYVGLEAMAGPGFVEFCDKRPAIGVTLANAELAKNVFDSCGNCR
ncbi:hypothetical protein CBR_g39435 [Chara braunii]|uniref:Right handed beta helix domain-containing protein n=1 Tax=Chara braunii TaxID=69332 RepID=A0A388LRZ5_CHABU|nr:hypothetical protein CBR_g39435 [Chara braunii]|eukprot:GBG84972.1 hypothetical protein CBR_g39435 [Chara braunii]